MIAAAASGRCRLRAAEDCAIIAAMLRWGLLAVAYATMAAVALVVSELWLGRSVWMHPDPWFTLRQPVAHVYSLTLGVSLGALIVIGTRRLVERFGWARELASALRPFARGLSGPGIVVIAVLSSIGEELLFRGLLQPWLGLWLQALLFGALHQVRGSSRWAWVAWAGAVGLLFGAIFAATGSLFGPIAAHAVVNGFNLNYLQGPGSEPSRRGLGGLLGERSGA